MITERALGPDVRAMAYLYMFFSGDISPMVAEILGQNSGVLQ